jgi:hypothetical protein
MKSKPNKIHILQCQFSFAENTKAAFLGSLKQRISFTLKQTSTISLFSLHFLSNQA